ncbi:MAG: hypothetical protein ACRD0P_29380 [Stackebrandtia sp.]
MNRLLRAEFRRLATTRLWQWGLLAAVACGGGVAALSALVGPQHFDPPMPGLETAEGVRNVLGLIGITVIVPALLGTVTICGEYRHGTITTTFGFVPRRWQVLAAKLLGYAAAGGGYGVVLATSAGLGLYGGTALTGTTVGLPFGTVASLLARIAVAMAVYTVLGVAVGA